jgi:hypothetical protein
MIDDMALLKLAMEQMDAEDPAVAQTAKDRAAQILGDARLSFSKMAELIEQRRLLLRPRIVASIKRMDQPGMLGESAFRDTGSALRKEGQSFGQIAEAIELTGRLAPRYEDPAQMGEPLHQMVSEPGAPAWRSVPAFVTRIAFFRLRRRLWLPAIALLVIFLFYALRGFSPLGQQASGYSDGVAAVRHSADQAMSSVNSFVNEHILRQSKEATAPPTPAAPIPSAPAPAAAPASATPPAAPATASAPPATAPTASAPASVPAAPPSAAPPGPPVSTPSRDASKPAAKSAANAGAAREDCCPRSRRAPFGDDRPRVLEEMIPPGIRRNSRTAGPCIGGVGGCSWGGGQY